MGVPMRGIRSKREGETGMYDVHLSVDIAEKIELC
jgi:hypothetical protein